MSVTIPQYKMNHKSRGSVLIFNSVKYRKPMEERKHSVVDLAKVMKCLTSLGYPDVGKSVKTDLKASQMREEIQKVARMDHSNCDSVVIVFLTYGEQNLIIAKDGNIGLQKLLAPLKGDVCHESLVGKPKIIILQTCNPKTRLLTNDEGDNVRHVVPTEADFVYVGTEVPGLFPGREVHHGSLMIEHLCRQLTEAGNTSIELRQVITRTLRDVVREMDEKQPNWSDYDRRMPYFISQLTRDLYFVS